jgi:hypothetical protein
MTSGVCGDVVDAQRAIRRGLVHLRGGLAGDLKRLHPEARLERARGEQERPERRRVDADVHADVRGEK